MITAFRDIVNEIGEEIKIDNVPIKAIVEFDIGENTEKEIYLEFECDSFNQDSQIVFRGENYGIIQSFKDENGVIKALIGKK
jgi:hypothetical protein